MTDAHIAAICAEYGIRIVGKSDRLSVKETRATACLRRIYEMHGEGHFRLVLSTVAETENNAGRLHDSLLYAVSDLVLANRELIEDDASRWLAVFDRCEVGQIQWEARGADAIMSRRHYIAAGIFRHVYREFGDRAIEPDLFDDERVA
ncbi:hypothetical protein JET14_13360 [Martelella lutilitoris]|uniref:Uncharacterized protein n=1 Tax=Martelella lutilitoris TaxID=2583532 RepID=A0A7T7KK48_9HYPH|nr:hypothetical protein [Martelella lutilitoris]QQM29312.1 hypothetical protein JET14_13360 [Martelella lutilitoris]